MAQILGLQRDGRHKAQVRTEHNGDKKGAGPGFGYFDADKRRPCQVKSTGRMLLRSPANAFHSAA